MIAISYGKNQLSLLLSISNINNSSDVVYTDSHYKMLTLAG